MSTTIDLLLALVIGTTILFLISAYQELRDHINEVHEYEARIKELQELLDEQERRREAEFNRIVAAGEEEPEQRAYFIAKAINSMRQERK